MRATSCARAGTPALRIAFGTNNALLERETIAARLQGMGIEASAEELVTAPDSLASVVQGAGHTHVVRLGAAGLRESLERVGIAAPDVMDAQPGDGTALAVGLDPERSLAGVARAAAFVAGRRARVRDGGRAAATRPTAGSRRGRATMLAALNAMSPCSPELCGKPSRHFGERAAQAVDTGRPVLVVGDSLAADVGVATAMGWDSLLVLTGPPAKRMSARQDLRRTSSPTLWRFCAICRAEVRLGRRPRRAPRRT